MGCIPSQLGQGHGALLIFMVLVFDILHNIRNIYCASERGNGLFSPQKRVLGWEMTGMRCQVKDWVAQLKVVNPWDQDSGGRN